MTAATIGTSVPAGDTTTMGKGLPHLHVCYRKDGYPSSGSNRATIAPKQTSTTNSLRSCASRASGQNLSMTQNKIAPRTTIIRIPITSVSTAISRHLSGDVCKTTIGPACWKARDRSAARWRRWCGHNSRRDTGPRSLSNWGSTNSRSKCR